MRQENQKLHSKLKESNDAVIQMENQLAEVNQEKREVYQEVNELKRALIEKDNQTG